MSGPFFKNRHAIIPGPTVSPLPKMRRDSPTTTSLGISDFCGDFSPPSAVPPLQLNKAGAWRSTRG
jgi:hypothetical protein